jgi:riboflavin biosynthesis pyrimidine reductase
VQEVFPDQGERSVTDLYDDPRRRRLADRPWIVLSMISSADGAMAIGETSGGLGSDSDRSVFRHLRSIADGVLVGARTVRSESYSPLPSHQTLVVVSQTGNLGVHSSALTSAGNTLVVDGEVRGICTALAGDIWILEGGPSLNAQMLAADCIDEVCLTVAPRFLSSDAGRIIGDGEFADHQWDLIHIAHDEGFVFLRYLRKRSD